MCRVNKKKKKNIASSLHHWYCYKNKKDQWTRKTDKTQEGATKICPSTVDLTLMFFNIHYKK